MRRHITYANVVSTLCLFIVLGGGAFAATKLPKNSVTSTQIKNGSIKGPDIAKSAIRSANVKNGSLLASDFKTSSLLNAVRGPQGPIGPQGPAGKNAATNVVVRIARVPTGGNSAAVACAPGERAVGGGGLSGANTDGIAASFPLTNGGTSAVTEDGQVPDGWSITSGQTGAHTAYVICASP